MNSIHYRYLALIALNIVAATLCFISIFIASNTTMAIYDIVLSAVNAFLIWFNFGQMNRVLTREGYEPVTMKSIKFSLAVSAFFAKVLYK